MVLKLYNTLTRKKEIFKPLNGTKVNMFTCGITPYDHSHIGHSRVAVTYDLLAKYLKYKGYKVFYLQNITDIDDKIINRANETGENWKEIPKKYFKEYKELCKKMNVTAVNKYAPATNYIKEIISQVKRLKENGLTYELEDGIYFDISKFRDYGKLSQQPREKTKRRIKNDKKMNEGDFVLWKFKKEGEPFWKAEIGNGRPGWHIEDTAITEKELGEQYDLHGGGQDLIFPHHEAEIAQMEGITGKKPFVKYWIHNAFVQINKTKMSKSLNNFFTIKEVLEKHDPLILRYALISTHHRSPINFSEELLTTAQNSLDRINEFITNLQNTKGKKEIKVEKYEKQFENAMDDDLNISEALAVIFNLIKDTNKILDQLSNNNAKNILKLLKKFNSTLGIINFKQETIPKQIKELFKEREESRKNKDYNNADKLRDKIKELGYQIDDKRNMIKKI